jgi:prepilin-type N-terminal cleavage/methylation domain-containing protein
MIKKGFTLIELLIVIAVIGILAVAFLPSLLNAPAKARDVQRIEDVKKIGDFFTAKYVEIGTVPTSACVESGTDVGDEISANIDDFGGVFPKDPDPSNAIGACKGFYIFLNGPEIGGENSKYAFFVLTAVEDTKNGNMDGSDLGNIVVGNDSLKDEGEYYAVGLEL